MIKIKSIILALLLTLFLISCSTLKDGFSSQRKNSSDEFLIEKKSPLVMPPDFDELPVPQTAEILDQENSNDIKSLIGSKNTSSTSNSTNEINQELEDLILEKIKKN